MCLILLKRHFRPITLLPPLVVKEPAHPTCSFAAVVLTMNVDYNPTPEFFLNWVAIIIFNYKLGKKSFSAVLLQEAQVAL